ncbi:MAG: hypothetical protein Q3980_13040 [Turicibacter sp.]|nr:hypothetical protein [Turicibacter sp.]
MNSHQISYLLSLLIGFLIFFFSLLFVSYYDLLAIPSIIGIFMMSYSLMKYLNSKHD